MTARMDRLWAPACTGYPGADNNDYYDRLNSYGYLRLVVKKGISTCAHSCLHEYAFRHNINRTGITVQWQMISQEPVPKMKNPLKSRINVRFCQGENDRSFWRFWRTQLFLGAHSWRGGYPSRVSRPRPERRRRKGECKPLGARMGKYPLTMLLWWVQ